MNSENDLDRILNRVWVDLDWKLFLGTPLMGANRGPIDRSLFKRADFPDELDSILEEELTREGEEN